MWRCDNCGEEENESNFRFCIACGTSKSVGSEDRSHGADVNEAFRTFAEDGPKTKIRAFSASSFAGEDTPREHRVTGSIGDRIKAAFSGRSSNSLNVKVSPLAEERLAQLVQAGVFPEISEAAGYLLEEGIKSQTRLFEIVEQKISEIERLRAELRNLVNEKHL